jgi:DNA repair protein RecN (Recombination protein N)|tara:strand:+ start:2998 stop:4713 length:1716 start_codon:yes stop_codon:yes gene_type:complete
LKKRSLLQELSIKNLGVIDSAEVSFSNGLTVITGETGAGKTMVLTALNLILGAKSDSDLIRHGEERLQVAGIFDLTDEISKRIDDLGGVVEDEQVIINRSLTSQGRSKITIGGAPSTTAQVIELGESLIEIHAQSSSQRLAKSSVQRELLDAFGSCEAELVSYSKLFAEQQNLRMKIKELESQLSARDSEIVKLSEFLVEFKKYEPKIGELSDIDSEIGKLGSVEELNTALISGLGLIAAEDSSLLSSLANSRKTLDQIKGRDINLDPLIDRFGDAIYELNESFADLERYLSSLEADPARYDFLQNRKSDLNTLIKKYGQSSDRMTAFSELLERAALTQDRIADLQGGEDRILQLRNLADENFMKLQEAGRMLTKKRSQGAMKLASGINIELTQLAMANAKVVVQVESSSSREFRNFSSTGLDEISFLFTSHEGGKLLPINKVASGGELSRVMLGVEVVLAQSSPVGTYVFDEVDAGVGGKAAVEVGRRLARLAKNSQVIVVTHLAQVACWADSHVVVAKSENGSVTQSDLSEVTGEARLKEIARLLSGQENSQTAREHARELLELVAQAR